MKISVSMLSTYLFCSRKLFLQQVLELEEPPKESLILGSIRHEIFDYINKTEEKIVSSIIEKTQHENLIEIYKNNYIQKTREVIIKNKPRIREVSLDIIEAFRRTWPSILEEANTRAKNIFDFITKNNIYGKELWEKLTPKIVSEFKIDSDSLQLKGIIDRLEIHENNYLPIEFKTGKMPKEGVWPGHRIQVAAYALLLEEKFKTNINHGIINYLDSKETRRVTINPFMKDEIKTLVEEIQKLIKNKEIPGYCDNKNKCFNCGLKDTCYNENKVSVLMSEIH